MFNSSPPQILSASVYPQKVMPGQVMIVTVQVKDTWGIKSAVAIFGNEKMPDERNIPLITGTGRDGVYETRWIAHDTKNQAWYNTTIIFTNILGKKSIETIEWQDPTTSHKASDITAGTFGAGDYVFPGNLNVSNRLNASAYSVGATAGWSGFYYINESIDSYTKLLIHADGTNGSTTFTDSATAKTVTANGQVYTDTRQSKFGGASGFFDGSGDYLSSADSADWYFGSGDFTIDFWARFNSWVGVEQMIVAQVDEVNNDWLQISRTGADKLQMQFIDNSVTKGQYTMTSITSFSTNIWYHLAFVRNGTTGLIFIDGVSQDLTVNTAFGTNDVGDIAANLEIGRWIAAAPYAFNGWLDEFRISKGIARWTSNFDVRTSAYGGDKTVTMKNGIITGFG